MNHEDLQKGLTALHLHHTAARLDQIIAAADQHNWSIRTTLDHLIAAEIEHRNQRIVKERFRDAKLDQKLTVDQFDFHFHSSRKAMKSQLTSLLDLAFIDQKKDLIFVGNPGTGKTFWAKTLAYAATLNAKKVLFITAMDMINQLIAAETGYTLINKLKSFAAPHLLVIDEIGYLPLNANGSNMFFQVITSRHGKVSTIVTTNLVFSNWAKIFDSVELATAIADRLVQNSEIFVMGGPSYRKKQHLN